MNGMNPEPCASYSLRDRFTCDTCGEVPDIVRAEGRDPMTVTFRCHGKTLLKNFSKKDLVFTQRVFEKEELE